MLERIMELAAGSGLLSRKSIWTGRVISGLIVLFLLFDSITKIILSDFVVKASSKFGFSTTDLRIIGIILLVCIILYVIPRSSVLGAVLLTGYLGGAVEINFHLGNSLFSQTLFPVYFGILVWAGLYLRNRKLRNLLPFNQNEIKQSKY